MARDAGAVPRYCVHGSQDIGSNMQALAKANLPPLLIWWRKAKFNWSPSGCRKAGEVSVAVVVADDG